MKSLPFDFEGVLDGSGLRRPVHAPTLTNRHCQRSLRHAEKRLGVVPGDQAVLFLETEAAVADAVQGHHETARRHGFERRQIKSLPFSGQTDNYPTLAKQGKKSIPVNESGNQKVLNAGCIQSIGQGTGKIGALVADDRDRLPSRLVPCREAVSRRFEGTKVDSIRDRQNRTIRLTGGADGIGDLRTHADPDGSSRELLVCLPELVGVANMLNEVDPGDIQRIQVQLVPRNSSLFPQERAHPGTRAPNVPQFPLSGGPESLAFLGLPLVRRFPTERDPGHEPGHAPYVFKVVRMLEKSAVQTLEVPVEPDCSGLPCLAGRSTTLSHAIPDCPRAQGLDKPFKNSGKTGHRVSRSHLRYPNRTRLDLPAVGGIGFADMRCPEQCCRPAEWMRPKAPENVSIPPNALRRMGSESATVSGRLPVSRQHSEVPERGTPLSSHVFAPSRREGRPSTSRQCLIATGW